MISNVSGASIIKPRMDAHVVPALGNHGLWAIKLETVDRYTGLFNTQVEAVGYAIGLARAAASSVVVHGENGQIRTVFTYRGSNMPITNKGE